jgi:2-polyprenyl-3-methyl-5-hydroxy-6-metoxy-1,4-benzoquinol methylase
MSSASANINNSFFEGIYKDVWKGLIPNGLTEAEVDFIMEAGSLESDDRVLDIMCGYGRHALELGRRGIKVTAVDNLKDYIEEIKDKSEQEGLSIEPVLSGALEVELSGNYDTAVCMGNSFAFFDKDDSTTLLKKIASHLKPGGILIINSWMIAEIAIKHFREKDWHYVNGYKYLLDYRFLFHPSRIESEQTLIASNGNIEVIKGIDYIFTLDELESMFKEAGLTTKHLYSTPRKRPFNLGDGRIYIVAERIA